MTLSIFQSVQAMSRFEDNIEKGVHFDRMSMLDHGLALFKSTYITALADFGHGME